MRDGIERGNDMMQCLLGRVRVGLPILLLYALAGLSWSAAHSSVWAAGLAGLAIGATRPQRAAQTLLTRLWRAYQRYRDNLDANEPIPEPTVKFVPVFM